MINTDEEGKKGESTDESSSEKSAEGEKKKEEPSQGEFSAMQQAEKAKAALIEGKGRIFEKGPLDPLVGTLLSEEIPNLENLICQPIIPTIIKAKLYELLSALIQVGDVQICEKIYQSKIINFLILDYSRFEDNSNILILLNGVVKSVITNQSGIPMAERMVGDLKLIEFFATKLSHSDYKESLAKRKNIYPFIHNITSFLLNYDKPSLKERLAKC